MKRSVTITLSAVIISLFAIVGVTFANSSGGWSPYGIYGEDVTIEKGETHDGSLYVVGSSVTVENDVDGSLYCMGQRVVVTGNVSGDVICAAQELTINGTVGEDLRAAGQQVAVNSTVAGDASIFAQLVTIDSEATIAGDLNGGAQSLTLNGDVEKNFRYGAQLITLGGTVNGVSDLSVDRLDVTDGKLVGDVYYQASSPIDIAKNSEGEVTYNPVKETELSTTEGAAAFLLMTGLSMAVFAIVVTLLAPRFLERARKFTSQDALNTVLVGLVAVYATPFILIMLMLSVVGIPVAFFMIFVWLAVLMLSGPFFAYLIGSWILGSSRNIIFRMLVGIITLLILYIIPLINIFVIMTAGVVGSGMVIRGLTRGYQKPEYTLEAVTKAAKKKSKK